MIISKSFQDEMLLIALPTQGIKIALHQRTSMEKLPFKIEPDNLKDTIVEYHYQSDVPHEVLPGLVFELLKDSFKIVPRPTSHLQLDLANLLKLAPQDGMVLTDDFAKIHFRKESIVFNTVGKYPGWEKYSDCIFNTMTSLYSAGFVKKVQRIGVRYISEFAGQSIFEVMKNNPQIPLLGTTNKNTTYRTEMNYQGCEVIFSVADKVPGQGDASGNSYFSLVDIISYNVFEESPITMMDTLITATTQLHEVEKAFFFNVLKPEYLATLNPQYQ